MKPHRTIELVLEDALRKLTSKEAGEAYELLRLDFSRAGLQPGVDLHDKEALAELLGDTAPRRSTESPTPEW